MPPELFDALEGGEVRETCVLQTLFRLYPTREAAVSALVAARSKAGGCAAVKAGLLAAAKQVVDMIADGEVDIDDDFMEADERSRWDAAFDALRAAIARAEPTTPT